MSEFITNLKDLKDGDDIVVTMTGQVHRSDSSTHGISFRTGGGVNAIFQDEVDDGSISVERIHLKEKKALEPGVYQGVFMPSVLWVKGSDGSLFFVMATDRGTVEPAVVTDAVVLRDLERGKIRKLS